MLAPTARAAPHSKSDIRRRKPAKPDPARDQAIRDRLYPLLEAAFAVAFVWPLGDEPDLRALMDRLHAEGRTVALPVVTAPGAALEFRRWHPAAAMEPGPHGTRHPGPAEPPVRPDIILVPITAFDRQRNRLGRGGGYYDRTLAANPGARAIGFAYCEAEIAAVPTEPHDRHLDLVVTERESL